MKKPSPVRRLVTGQDSHGLSWVTEDNFATNIACPIPQNEALALINLWQVKSIPASLSESGKLAHEVPLAPGLNGINFRYVDFPPDETYVHFLNQSHAIKEAWDKLKTEQEELDKTTLPHPLMHKTKTLDFGIVISGEIYLILDKEERLMKAGDVAIQRGTNHAWSNRTKENCRMAFILIDAE